MNHPDQNVRHQYVNPVTDTCRTSRNRKHEVFLFVKNETSEVLLSNRLQINNRKSIAHLARCEMVSGEINRYNYRYRSDVNGNMYHKN